MRKFIPVAISALLITCATVARAEPIMITDDEGYARLARWEKHLDDQIVVGIRYRTLDPRRAWSMQKELDSVEIHLLQAYYDSDNGIDGRIFGRFADQLRHIGAELGDRDWHEESFGDQGYGPGYGQGGGYDQSGRDQNYGPPPPQGNYYREGDYEANCHRGNQAAGTIFGALAGGLIGSAASHGNGGAVVGGVILGGLLGNQLTKDVDCDDQRYAFQTYNDGLNGDLNREYQWHHGDRYGTFTSQREYYDHGMVCRDFHTANYRDGQRMERDGRACRQTDGYWHFD